jgi:hypothetical protein
VRYQQNEQFYKLQSISIYDYKDAELSPACWEKITIFKAKVGYVYYYLRTFRMLAIIREGGVPFSSYFIPQIVLEVACKLFIPR